MPERAKCALSELLSHTRLDPINSINIYLTRDNNHIHIQCSLSLRIPPALSRLSWNEL